MEGGKDLGAKAGGKGAEDDRIQEIASSREGAEMGAHDGKRLRNRRALKRGIEYTPCIDVVTGQICDYSSSKELFLRERHVRILRI